MKWKGVGVILTTNSLPPIMIEPERTYNETDIQFHNRMNDHLAMMSRCKLTEVKVSHSNSDIFPYSADMLALYM